VNKKHFQINSESGEQQQQNSAIKLKLNSVSEKRLTAKR